MERLKKCPFCGGKNIGVWERKTYSFFPPLYAVHCYDCHYGLQELSTKEKAIAAWNTRKPMERIVERVHGYFVSEINALPTDEIPHDILRHNKQICKIVKEEMQ